MRLNKHSLRYFIGAIIMMNRGLSGGVQLQVRDGRPLVDGVYVNGHGPYRFLLDTASNVNLIEAGIAKKIGMNACFRVDLGSAAGKIPTSGSDGNEVSLDAVKAIDQKFLYSQLDAIHNSSPDVRGVLGQWFLARFDYTIDLRNKRLEFGKRDPSGAHVKFKMINARPVVPTSLGDLVLDSAATRLTLFGVRPDSGFKSEMRTLSGSLEAGLAFGRRLVIAGRAVWAGDAIAIASQAEPNVDGLLPLSLFGAVYVSNSEGYVAFE